MKIRLKDSYPCEHPKKGVLYDAIKGDGCYAIIYNGESWRLSDLENIEEVDEFEEAFSKHCTDDYAGKIYFPSGHLETVSDWVFSHNGRLVHKEDIQSLILALLKLMD